MSRDVLIRIIIVGSVVGLPMTAVALVSIYRDIRAALAPPANGGKA